MGELGAGFSPRVLLVEDNDDLRKMGEITLVRAGYRVTSLRDGRRALDQLDDGHDVYVFDVMLPSIDGLELTRLVRAVDPRAAVVLISALGHHDEIARGLEAGADAYLTKPYPPQRLVEKVTEFAQRSTVG